MMFQKFIYTILLAWWAIVAAAQTATVKGILQDAATQKPIEDAELMLGEQKARTDANGKFEFKDVPYGLVSFKVSDSDDDKLNEDYTTDAQQLNIQSAEVDLGVLFAAAANASNVSGEDIIPATGMSGDGDDDRSGASSQNVSGILTASRDVFVSTTAFVFGPLRFRLRGYDQENTAVFMNGVPMNDLETGNPSWNLFGGLNDVMRGRDINYGLQPLSFSFGALAGGTDIDARASKQRKQVRFSYSLSNRAYNQRVMLTYNTGILKNGWAFSLSGSRRWAQEGYIEGSTYDSWAYFAAAEKKIGKHAINLSILGTPTLRGGNTPTFGELYDLAGSNFYNTQWGYQNGEKRNARITNIHQPMAVLNHEWKIDENTNLNTSISGQFGKNGVTALDWYNAPDPRPDYYRYLPSYYAEDSAAFAQLTAAYQNDPSVGQINWDNLYDVNRNSQATVNDANGQAGNTVTGNRAKYVLAERRRDTRKVYFNTVFDKVIKEKLHVYGGLVYKWEATRQFQLVNDLLGADYFVDVDRFAERDSGIGSDFSQANLDKPNHIVRVGDQYGYDYTSETHLAKTWGQAVYSLKKFEFFAAAELSNSRFWRVGNVRNGKFPDNSAGKSAVQNFWNGAFKAGGTYKLDGRNFFFVNGAYMTRAPHFNNAFIAPRVRDQVIPNLVSEQIVSVEGGYILKSPNYNARAVGYYTKFNNEFNHRTFFLDNAITSQSGEATGGFVNYVMSGIDKRHAGVELAFEAKIATGLKAAAVASIGQFVYTSRPEVSIYLDNAPAAISANRTAYMKNYFIAGTPQQAYNVSLNYSGKQFYFLTLNFNYVRNNWIDINPDRRTTIALSYVDNPTVQQDAVLPSSELGQQIIGQQKAKDAFTLDFFGGKSFKIKKYFLYLNLGISNILNNRDIMTWGFEQLRFDYEEKNTNKFPARYSYNFGLNYFVNISFRM